MISMGQHLIANRAITTDLSRAKNQDEARKLAQLGLIAFGLAKHQAQSEAIEANVRRLQRLRAR